MKLFRGETLLGLIISIGLSAFLLLTIIQFYSYSQQQNREGLLRLQLQAEMQRLIQIIGKDLRRAGGKSVMSNLGEDNFSLFEQSNNHPAITIAQRNAEKQNSCVLFFYDLDGNGCLGSGHIDEKDVCVKNNLNMMPKTGMELFGYQLDGRELKTKSAEKMGERCSKESCQTYLQPSACDTTSWRTMIDVKQYHIDLLEFESINNWQAIQVKLKGHLAKHPKIQYETTLLTPLLNQEQK